MEIAISGGNAYNRYSIWKTWIYRVGQLAEAAAWKNAGRYFGLVKMLHLAAAKKQNGSTMIKKERVKKCRQD